jgi:nitrite reductase/ring-hydroxylating ferredoxin subunit
MTQAGEIDLCALDELDDPGSRGFDLELGGQRPQRVFIVRHRGRLVGYRNRCPHTGVPLEWQPDTFLDPDDSFIQCATHGALFRPEDGYCVRGPCSGQSLTALRVIVRAGRVLVALPLPD